MALIKCRNCGLPMSSYIKTCPSCGQAQAEELPEKGAEIALETAVSIPAPEVEEKAEEAAVEAATTVDAAEEKAEIALETAVDISAPEVEEKAEEAAVEAATTVDAAEEKAEIALETAVDVPAPEVEEKAEEAVSEPAKKQMRLCPLCLETVESGDKTEICPVCQAAHHADCWSKNGGCGMPGCSAHNEAVPKAARARHENIVVPQDTELPDNFESFINDRRGGGVGKRPVIITVIIIALLVVVAVVGSKFLNGSAAAKNPAPAPAPETSTLANSSPAAQPAIAPAVAPAVAETELAYNGTKEKTVCADFGITMVGAKLIKTERGTDAVAVKLIYSNDSAAPAAFRDKCSWNVIQSGVYLGYDHAFYGMADTSQPDNSPGYWADNKVAPGATIELELVYELYNVTDEVTFEALGAAATPAAQPVELARAAFTFK